MIAARYAKALLISAKEKNILDEIENDFLFLEKLIEEVPEFHYLIADPFIKDHKKIETISSVISKHVNKLTVDFIKLVFENKRDEHLAHIVKVFLDKYRQEKGIKKVVLTLTREISQQAKDNIINAVKDTYKNDVELTEKINPKLLGGFILRVEDLQLDATVANKLKKLHKKLTTTI